jgi:hypothetical protein
MVAEIEPVEYRSRVPFGADPGRDGAGPAARRRKTLQGWRQSAALGQRAADRRSIPSRKAHALVNGASRVELESSSVRGVLGLLVLAMGLLAQSGDAAEIRPGPQRQVLVFDRFVGSSAAVCLYQPAAECVDAAWLFADQDGDHGLSVAELQEVRDGLRAWAVWRTDDLTATERSLLALGFLVVDGLGVQRLHALYDVDQDGLVDRDELLADVRLDERPLGEVLLDGEALDRAALAARLGVPPALIDRLRADGQQ